MFTLKMIKTTRLCMKAYIRWARFVPTAVGLPQNKQNKANKHSIGESGRIWFLFLLSIGQKQLTI